MIKNSKGQIIAKVSDKESVHKRSRRTFGYVESPEDQLIAKVCREFTDPVTTYAEDGGADDSGSIWFGLFEIFDD